jgi:hypothetical protein
VQAAETARLQRKAEMPLEVPLEVPLEAGDVISYVTSPVVVLLLVLPHSRHWSLAHDCCCASLRVHLLYAAS